VPQAVSFTFRPCDLWKKSQTFLTPVQTLAQPRESWLNDAPSKEFTGRRFGEPKATLKEARI